MAASTALNVKTASVSRDAPIKMSAILRAQEALTREDPTERQHAGRLRTVQNWIGGRTTLRETHSTYRHASHDVPAHGRSGRLREPHAVAQARLESVHPSTNGNGCIGRALIGVIFRRRGATTPSVVSSHRRLLLTENATSAHSPPTVPVNYAH